MANALTLTAAAMPAANGPLAGVVDGANVNGNNSAGYTYAGAAVPGAGDTIANAELLKGLDTGSRLYEVLNEVYASQADLDAAFAAVGLMAHVNGGSALRFVLDGASIPANKPGATVTTAAATGSLRISIAHSATR